MNVKNTKEDEINEYLPIVNSKTPFPQMGEGGWDHMAFTSGP